MKLQKRNQKRGEYAIQIMKLGKEIRKLSSQKAYIERNNQLPPELQEVSLDDIGDRAELHQKLLNNRGYISKNRTRSDKQEEVNRRMRENEDIKKILDGSN